MFNKPTIFNGKHAVAIKILILLMMKPGTDFLHPEMGIDIVGRYRYCDEDDLDELQEEINNQLEAYLPNMNIVSVNVSMRDNDIVTKINIDDTVYTFKSDDKQVKNLEELDDKTVFPETLGHAVYEEGSDQLENWQDDLDQYDFFPDIPSPTIDPI